MKTGYEITKDILRAARSVLRSPIDELAKRLGKSRSYVEKIIQEPKSDDNPDGDGLPNCIDQFDAVFEFALLYAPAEARVLANRYPSRLAQHENLHRMFLVPSPSEFEAQVKRFFDELKDNFTVVALNGGADDMEREWAESEEQFKRLVAMKRAAEDHGAATIRRVG